VVADSIGIGLSVCQPVLCVQVCASCRCFDSVGLGRLLLFDGSGNGSVVSATQENVGEVGRNMCMGRACGDDNSGCGDIPTC
jgi:hypothetical protein